MIPSSTASLVGLMENEHRSAEPRPRSGNNFTFSFSSAFLLTCPCAAPGSEVAHCWRAGLKLDVCPLGTALRPLLWEFSQQNPR